MRNLTMRNQQKRVGLQLWQITPPQCVHLDFGWQTWRYFIQPRTFTSCQEMNPWLKKT